MLNNLQFLNKYEINMKKLIIFVFFVSVFITHAQWERCDTGLTTDTISGIAVSGNNIFAITYGGGVFFSSDYGSNWSQRNNGLTNLIISSIAVNGNYIFIIAVGSNGGIFRSSDNGINWSLLNNTENFSVFTLFSNEGLVIAASANYLYLTTDNGSNWIIKNNINDAWTIYKSGNIIYSGNLDGVYSSTDSGGTWNPFNDLNGLQTAAIAKKGNNIYVGGYGKKNKTDNTLGGLYISTDNGSTWSYKYRGTKDSNGYVDCIIVIDNMILIGGDGFIYLSTNNGNNWTRKNDGIPNTSSGIWTFAVCGNYIFAGTFLHYPFLVGNGICRALISDFTDILDKKHTPDNILFPNPAGTFTKLGYSTSGSSDVNVLVRDITGEKVKEFTNIQNQNSGENVCELDTSGLASGTYFITLTSGTQIFTKKLVLIK